MISLRDVFKKQTGFLRGQKLSYVINNLLNAGKLNHNRVLYQKYGLKKSIYGPIGSHDFQPSSDEIPWLDHPRAEEALIQHPDFQSFTTEEQAMLKHFVEKGYLILQGFYDEEEVEKLNEEVARLLEQKKADFNYTGRKIMDAHRQSALINEHYFKNPRLLNLLKFIMGRKVIPFQTINFIEGSEQRAHSDSIHMTTHPPGYLIAAWTALEDTHERNGPLFYYPFSHRLPYLLCKDYDSGNTTWQLGENSYRRYEKKVEEILKNSNLKKEYFFARKGDVLVWHANLLHGGSPISQTGTTRKSMVAHYFCEGVICYHEISQRPALMGD
jgi:ectoine hydroxylase-related dioxygenase (phytanoyl-CoA dioxygenase family)